MIDTSLSIKLNILRPEVEKSTQAVYNEGYIIIVNKIEVQKVFISPIEISLFWDVVRNSTRESLYQ